MLIDMIITDHTCEYDAAAADDDDDNDKHDINTIILVSQVP